MAFTSRRTMSDGQLDAQLSERGWVVVPLLSGVEVATLRDFYYHHAAMGLNPKGAYDSTYAEFSVIHSHPDFRAVAYESIAAIVGRRSRAVLDCFEPLVANFVNKPPGTGIVPMHQNWAVVDEDKFRSVSVWVALVDTTMANGALELLAGSHRVFREPRGMWAYEAFDDITEIVRPLLESVPVKAGEAIILDDAVVHYSPPNRDDSDRLAIQLVMVPAEAPALFCQRVGSEEDVDIVDVWQVDKEFFWNFWHGVGDPAHGHVVRQVRVPSSRMDPQGFWSRFGEVP